MGNSLTDISNERQEQAPLKFTSNSRSLSQATPKPNNIGGINNTNDTNRLHSNNINTNTNTINNTKKNVIILNDKSYNNCSDLWDIENPKNNKYIELNDNIPNTVHLKKTKRTRSGLKEWITIFGTNIIGMGQSKVWKVKIIPSRAKIAKTRSNKDMTANIVIGICDYDKIKDIDNSNEIIGGFWKSPCYGYGYCGNSGKKVDFVNASKGKSYSDKYKINDVITVELIMNNNENNLHFYVNGVSKGIAFYDINDTRNYVLAVSLCDNNYDIQICQ